MEEIDNIIKYFCKKKALYISGTLNEIVRKDFEINPIKS